MSNATLEELLGQIRALPSRNATNKPERIRLWVASQLTWQGKSIPPDVAMAIALDQLLGLGFRPDGFTEDSGGRWYQYVREPSTD